MISNWRDLSILAGRLHPRWFAGAVLSLLLAAPSTSSAVPTVYFSEAAYLAAIGGYTSVHEGFEDPVWQPCDSGSGCVSRTSQGITWSGSDAVRVGSGWARTGNLGVFDSFGDPDSLLAVNGVDTLFGVGGWFSGSSANSVSLLLDGQLVASLAVQSSHAFIGVVDAAGFTSAGFGTPAGHWGADDFTFARGSAAVSEPGTVALLGLALAGLALRRRREDR